VSGTERIFKWWIVSEKYAFFLDRDGVLNYSGKRPPNCPDELRLIAGVGWAIKRLNELGFYVFVVTNQGGVGLGYMSAADLEAIHSKLKAEIAQAGGYIDDIMACTHAPHSGCKCRKPQPGMILALAKKHGIDLNGSYTVGDRWMDIAAGKNAGTKTIFIGEPSQVPDKVDLVSSSLAAAVATLFGSQ